VQPHGRGALSGTAINNHMLTTTGAESQVIIMERRHLPDSHVQWKVTMGGAHSWVDVQNRRRVEHDPQDAPPYLGPVKVN
jgi:hypothetical protein